jgi:hypothetical protein
MAGGTTLYVAGTSSLENYTNYISIILIITTLVNQKCGSNGCLKR